MKNIALLLVLLGTPIAAVETYGAKVGGTLAPDGNTEIQIDLPHQLHKHNISSRGSGCCVFRSISHAAYYQEVAVLKDFAEWVRSKGLPGGGYPGNVAERIRMICKEKGVPEPAYIQIEGKDLELLKAATRSGRMVSVTYSKSPTGRYNGGRIAHMVNLPHADDHYFAVLDNNYPGADKYEWMTPQEFATICNPGGRYWAVVLLAPPPPAPPRN